jgi:sugar lactone lactonase YvrE
MRKPNFLYLSLTAALLAAMPLLTGSARAAVGDIYETNMDLVLRINAAGGTPVTFAQGLQNPKGLAFDGNGHLFVANPGTGAILRFNTPDATPVTFAAGLNSPVGVTFDAAGNLFVSDAADGAIFKYTTDGSRVDFAVGLNQPAGIGFDSLGNLFVAEFNGGTLTKIAPNGAKSTFGSGLSFPAGIAVDGTNNVFVSDSASGTIYKFAPDGTRSTFATGLDRPYGLAFEGGGGLIVADNGSGSTFRFTPAGTQTTVFSSDFNTPQFVAIEPASHQLLNMSTRGFVGDSQHLLIAGFIVGGNGPVGTTVVIRALGPSLSAGGVADPLQNPIIGVRDAQGNLVAFNDNWNDAPLEQRVLPGLQPSNANEAALKLNLRGGSFTAVVAGVNGGTGTALVEVYNLP